MGEPLLPVKEATRGRSPGRVQRIVKQWERTHNKALIKGQMRTELGRFATAFNKSRTEPAAEPRAASVKPSRTFDEIAELEIPRGKLPFGAGLSKQRTSSEGALRLRFQGAFVK